jgi:hypothetical protein
MSLEQAPKSKEVPVEKLEQISQLVSEAKTLTMSERFMFILKDEKCKEAYEALLRSLINAFITIIDAFPIVGEATESFILGLKVAPWIKSLLSKYSKNPKMAGKHFDLLPDMSLGSSIAVAVGSAPVEAISGGTVPTYLVSALWQLKADIDNKRFDGAIDSMRVLMTGRLDKITPETQERLNRASKEFK